MVWGSDWPHPTVKEIANKPDDAVLFYLPADGAPDERTLRKVLVDNPATLYGFGPEQESEASSAGKSRFRTNA
jgi:D-galactarolactone isomerase